MPVPLNLLAIGVAKSAMMVPNQVSKTTVGTAVREEN